MLSRFVRDRNSIVRCIGLGVSACKQQAGNGPKTPEGNVASATRPSNELPKDSFKPSAGYVPDEQTAIAIAVAAWIPIYGKAQIESEKPYGATLKDGVWTVTGTLPPGYDGGTAVAEIAQTDGRILRVIHYQ